MRALLFRRIVVDGVNYYQLYDNVDDFKVDSLFGEYFNRDTHDFFYIDKDSGIEVPDESLLNIYCDDTKNDGLKVIDDELYDKVSKAFNDVYHYFGKEKKIDDIIDNISEKVIFQDNAVGGLVEQLFINQDIVNSDLPIDMKMSQKSNILLCGKVGTGKKSIIDALIDQIDIPYVDIRLRPDPASTLEDIIEGLLSKSKDGKDASRGIVFIRDNYRDLMDAFDDKTGAKIYSYINSITSQEVVDYDGEEIDFRTVTFVVLYDEYYDTKEEDIHRFENFANCPVRITTHDLTVGEKYTILNSPSGRLGQYYNFLKSQDKTLNVKVSSLIELIYLCGKIDPNMNLINSVIDGIIKMNIVNNVKNVYIDEKTVEAFAPMLEQSIKSIENKTVDDEYWFEKKVDKIVKEVTKDVVGQDKAVRMITHQLVKNLRWANKNDVEDPKKYIKNILIRGNTGTGKTFIASKILKLLDVPYFVADATEYTEAGYVGKDVEDMLVDLYHAAGDDLEKAERGVLVIDEVDKRASHGGASHDVSGSGVQEALYKFAEGTVMRINIGTRVNEIPLYFDTSRLTIICSGAFEGIEGLRDERVGKKKAGFGNQEVSEEAAALMDVDYINYGMKSQFMRRVKQIVELKDVSKEQFIDIMKKSNSSALKIEKDTYEDQGIEIEYTDDFYAALADKALSMKQGVTGIEKALLKVFQSINIQDIKPSKVKKIILNGDVINDPSKVNLVERGKIKTKSKRNK